jgi:hypothetical protein
MLTLCEKIPHGEGWQFGALTSENLVGLVTCFSRGGA